MCGPSGPSDVMKNEGAASDSFSRLLSSNYQTEFANQQNILDSINHSLSPTIAAGPSQQGFSAGELAALNTGAINNNAAASRNAIQAGANALAGRGGDSGLQSGVDKQIMSTIRSQSAGNLANQQTGIVKANYDQGNANYQRAVSGEQALAGLYDPTAYANSGLNANKQAFDQNNTINQQEQAARAQKWGLVTGAIGLGADFLTGGLSGLAGSAAGASQPGSFFSGGISALAGK